MNLKITPLRKAPEKDSLLATIEELAAKSERIERFWDESVVERPTLLDRVKSASRNNCLGRALTSQDVRFKRYSVRYALVYAEADGKVTAVYEEISRKCIPDLSLPENHKIILAVNLYESEFAKGRQELLAKIGEKGARNSKFKA